MIAFILKIYFSELFMHVDDFKTTRLFILLNEQSLQIPANEMEYAYLDFIEQIKMVSSSNDYSDIFRTLSFIRIELFNMNRKKNVLEQMYIQKSLSLVDLELELLHLRIQHPEQFHLDVEIFRSNLYIIPKSRGLGIIGFVELVVALFLLGEVYTKSGKLASLSDISKTFEQMFNFSFGCIFKKRIALFERKQCNLTRLLDSLKNLLIKEGNKQNEK